MLPNDADLRQKLAEAALAWERAFGVVPSITSAISEFDAAMLVGCTAENIRPPWPA